MSYELLKEDGAVLLKEDGYALLIEYLERYLYVITTLGD